MISAIIIQELIKEAVCLSHQAKESEEWEESSKILLEDGVWVEEEAEEVENANVTFLVRMLKEQDICSRKQEEKTSKLKAAIEKKKEKKLTKLQLAADSNTKITSFFLKKIPIQVETIPMECDEQEELMEWEDFPHISWSIIKKMEESRDRALRIRRAAAQKKSILIKLESRREEKKGLEQHLMDLLVESSWSRWSSEESSTTQISTGLVVSLAITPDISPGKKRAGGEVRAKGKIISWSLMTETRPALTAKEEERYPMTAQMTEALPTVLELILQEEPRRRREEQRKKEMYSMTAQMTEALPTVLESISQEMPNIR